MSAPEQNQPHAEDREGLFLRGAAAVGDLDSPFYAEERQRDVWNEASAVGLQLAIFLGIGAAAAMLWIAGDAARYYALAVILVVAIPSIVVMRYAVARGVDLSASTLGRGRLIAIVVLLLALLGGLLRDTEADEWLGTLTGMGLVLALAGAAYGIGAWRRRRAARR